MTDTCITLTGLRAVGFHGVFDHERTQGQEFVVDLKLWGDFDTKHDDLAQTVDYGMIASAVASLIEGPPVNLIETLAGRIADRALAEPRVAVAEVTVHKPQAPLSVDFGDVAVTVTRRGD